MRKVLINSAVFLGALALMGAGTGNAAPVALNMSGWEVEQYNFPDESASWSVSGNTVASQSINADASILHGGLESAGNKIGGNFRVAGNGDDDFLGFVFGYQNRGQYYLFDWKQGNQDHPTSGALAEQGMSVKVVNTAANGGGDPSATDLWASAGTDNVQSLYHNTLAWAADTDYAFSLNFTAGLFQIEVYEGDQLLESIILADDTYTNGEFGFYNYSQAGVTYTGFTIDEQPPEILSPTASRTTKAETIPEPTTLLLLGLGLAGIGYRRKRGN